MCTAVKSTVAKSVEDPPCVHMVANAVFVKFVVDRPFVSIRERNGHARIAVRKFIVSMDESAGYVSRVGVRPYACMIK